MAPEGTSDPTADEKRLAELGYSQDLERGWTRFTNFAISFSIISVLAGCFTTFYVAWNNGGPIAISLGWPIIALIILTVAFSMSELASAYPTAGGLYHWGSILGNTGKQNAPRSLLQNSLKSNTPGSHFWVLMW